MSISTYIRRIDRYLSKENVQPLIVDVQNRQDLSDLITHYHVGDAVFVAASDYSKNDEYPRFDTMFDVISRNDKRYFITGLSSFLKLNGESELKNVLNSILNMNTVGHVVVLTYQCKQYLNFPDPRLNGRICIIDGDADTVPEITFFRQGLPVPKAGKIVKGIHGIAAAIEHANSEHLYIETGKALDEFPLSVYLIDSISGAYEILHERDSATEDLSEQLGSEDEWLFALKVFKNNWQDTIDSAFGNHHTLELALPSLSSFDTNKKWLYFVGLKLYGATNSWCLSEAAKKATSVNDLARQAYRLILAIDPAQAGFREKYIDRKNILNCLGNPIDELVDFCKLVCSTGKNALYYLTDNTQKEKEVIFELLDRYGADFNKQELMDMLHLVYPALYEYLMPYPFSVELMSKYFEEYKYQKVINRVLPDFEELVLEQAEKREYNLLLEPRSSKAEAIDRSGAQLYFVDAMGVEYLSFIMSQCKKLGLMANVSVCACELPSITSRNKEFLTLFTDTTHPVVDVKILDELKHHGIDNFDYQQTKLPIHLSAELDAIADMLTKIKERLVGGSIEKAILISDHGASRLAVIHETENIWEMATKGEHSGRCCPKSDVDEQPIYASDAGDFWALANYDRFKGGRKADVEVHGGASWEEITVPIIELTYFSGNVEVCLMNPDATTIELDKAPEITVSFRKKAYIKIYVSARLSNISVSADGKFYNAVPVGDGFFTVEMPDIKNAATYYLDVYSCGNIIAEKLPLIVKKEGSSIRKMF